MCRKEDGSTQRRSATGDAVDRVCLNHTESKKYKVGITELRI